MTVLPSTTDPARLRPRAGSGTLPVVTYEYECAACKARWEAEQRITEPALTVCPTCTKPAARRLISQNTFILNGTGWEKKGGY